MGDWLTALSGRDLREVGLQSIQHFARPDAASRTPIDEGQDIDIAVAGLHLGDEGLPDMQALGNLVLRQPGSLATGHHGGAQGLVLRVIEGRGHAPDVLFRSGIFHLRLFVSE